MWFYKYDSRYRDDFLRKFGYNEDKHIARSNQDAHLLSLLEIARKCTLLSIPLVKCLSFRYVYKYVFSLGAQ
jgi:hypothetical protein